MRLALTVVSLLTCSHAWAAPSDYQFQRLFDTASLGVAAFDGAIVSANGRVTTGTQGGNRGIVVWDEVEGARFVARSIEDGFNAINSPSIGSDGSVYFIGRQTSGVTGLFRVSNGSITPILDTTDGFAEFGALVSSNDRDDLLFYARRGRREVLNARPGGLMVVSDPNAPVLLYSNPHVASNGRVVVRTQMINNRFGLLAADPDGTLKQVVETGGQFGTLGLHPSIAADGTIAFSATLPNGVAGIFLHTPAGLQTALLDSSREIQLLGNPSIDDDGRSIVFARYQSGATAILAREPGASAFERIIGSGDVLDGRTLSSVDFFRGSVSGGPFAFLARYSGGGEAIYFAVPEPASIAVALLMLTGWHIRPRS